ncbi:glyoxalase superfamily protein [Cerasicoccus maritimus]|uniref:glyoxalase superfamily protein n=1 Tax=Cerasicoccus maritimus TaxID=490089 RepID=UPI002852B795|nr:glyoxalase superfamily protein [Cerasicoccus maritimus]
MLLATVPVIRVSDASAAEAYFGDQLGFTKQWGYAPGNEPNPCYMGFQRDGKWIFVSSFPGDGVFGSVTSFIVENVDELFEEFKSRGVAIKLEPYDQTWGNREMHLEDPDGNKLNFIQEN